MSRPAALVRALAHACALLSATAFAACDDDASSGRSTALDAASGPTLAPPDAADVAAPDAAAPGPVVHIVVAGSLDARAPDDGLAGQTPEPYVYGLRRLELLTGPDDPEPVVVFDRAPGFVAVDLHGATTVAEVPLADLPEGRFTLFRIALTHVDLEVAVDLHGLPYVGDATTRVHVLYGLGSVAVDGVALAAGDAHLSGALFGVPFAFAQHVDPVGAAPGAGATASVVDGETRVTFPLAAPLVTTSTPSRDVTHTCRFYITDAFRWRDVDAPGHAPGRWDVDLPPGGGAPLAEPLLQVGSNAWATSVSEGPPSP